VPERRSPSSSVAAVAPRSRQGSGLGLLLVVLGEFVWRKQEAAWASAIICALVELGSTQNAARKAIQRATERGIIETRRHGREIQCVVTPSGDRLFSDGAERVFGFRGDSPDWDGRWLVVNVTVPEVQRNLRHHLKTGLTAARLGSPAPGVWITPHVTTSVHDVIARLGLESACVSFVGNFGSVGDEAAMVRAAWDISRLEADYRDFIDAAKSMRPRSNRAAFSSYVNLLQSWRRFPYKDPQLPREFLPRPWIGQRAAKIARERRNTWSARANAYWHELQS